MKTLGLLPLKWPLSGSVGMAMAFTLLVSSFGLIAQPGWKTVKDKTGACQMSVPPNWTLLSDPGWANSPQHTSALVHYGIRPFKPFSEETMKMLSIDHVYENSAKRIFYVTKPNGNPPLVSYHVEAPGKGNACVLQISLPPHTLEDDASKIALSLSKTP